MRRINIATCRYGDCQTEWNNIAEIAFVYEDLAREYVKKKNEAGKNKSGLEEEDWFITEVELVE